ncbi:MAG: glycosyltransferase [Fibrobacterota bacterium]
MIYLTVGAHFQGFDRLLREADALAPEWGEEVIAQTGRSLYAPRNMKAVAWLGYEEALRHIQQARFIIAHAGIGTIINAKKFGTPLVLVPRRKEFGEHTNDHQLEIVQALQQEQRPGIFTAEPLSTLKAVVQAVLNGPQEKKPGDFSGRDRIKILIADFMLH